MVSDNRSLNKLLNVVTKSYVDEVAGIPVNITHTCEYCGGEFLTSKGSTTGNCIHCGAPIKKGLKLVKEE